MLALRFWVGVLLWAGILLFLLPAISLISGQAVAEVVAHLPTWAGLALSLATFRAGISVGAETFPDGRLVQRRIAEMILAAAAVSVLMLTLGNYLAPIASRALQPEGREFVAEAVHMSLGQLGREARTAAERARAGGGGGGGGGQPLLGVSAFAVALGVALLTFWWNQRSVARQPNTC